MFIVLDKTFNATVKYQNFTSDIVDNNEYLLGRLSDINFFVGGNNMGKSSFLRNLLIQDKYKVVGSEKSLSYLREIETVLRHQSESVIDNAAFTISDITPKLNYFELSNNALVAFEFFLDKYPNNNILINRSYFADLILKFDNTNIEKVIDEINSNFQKLHAMIMVALEVEDTNKRLYYLNFTHSNYFRLKELHSYKLKPIFDSLSSLLEKYNESPLQVITPFEKRYVPILRTLSSLFDNDRNGNVSDKILSNIFETSVKKNYFKGSLKENIKIFTGLDFYEHILEVRNNEKKIRNNFEEFELFLSKTFFNGVEVDLIAKPSKVSKDMHISLYLGGTENDIHQFGDGVQALILLLYPIFTAQEETWIFIEEPELNLHPGFQRLFLDTLLNNGYIKAKKLKYFFTTHSNHLLDLSLTDNSNVSIFTFREIVNQQGISKIVSNINNSDIDSLELLGVSSSSVFIANCSVWVEGHSDTLYLRAFLKAYFEHFHEDYSYKEDLHYTYFEYSGSNVSHYLFEENEVGIDKEIEQITARFLSSKILLIADKDDSRKEKKHLALKTKKVNILNMKY
ncbi:MAG: AAA family ATPase [Bacteroidetes bacterium]|nr:AAA family ATPase [Bacteroidota bacterium]